MRWERNRQRPVERNRSKQRSTQIITIFLFCEDSARMICLKTLLRNVEYLNGDLFLVLSKNSYFSFIDSEKCLWSQISIN